MKKGEDYDIEYSNGDTKIKTWGTLVAKTNNLYEFFLFHNAWLRIYADTIHEFKITERLHKSKNNE